MSGRNWMLLILLCAAFAGCAKKEIVHVGAAPTAVEQPFGLAAFSTEDYVAGSPLAAPPAPRPTDKTLAYEHSIAIELDRESLPTRVAEIQHACQTDPQSGCTILDVSVSADERIPRAEIRMRLAPGSVDSLIAFAARGGKVANRTTHAEDLAEPVADTERQLTLLTTHRGRLEDLMKNRSLNVDQLIAASRELATVQTQIEQFSTTRANLRRRIDTDLLTISLSLPRSEFYAAQTPVMDAIKSFGNDLTEAVAQVIRFVAVLLPWLIVLVPGLVVFRWFWRQIGRWLQRRESRT